MPSAFTSKPSLKLLALFNCFVRWLYCFGSSTWGLSSPTRDQTRAPCTGSLKSHPLDCQGSPKFHYFKCPYPSSCFHPITQHQVQMPHAPSPSRWSEFAGPYLLVILFTSSGVCTTICQFSYSPNLRVWKAGTISDQFPSLIWYPSLHGKKSLQEIVAWLITIEVKEINPGCKDFSIKMDYQRKQLENIKDLENLRLSLNYSKPQ